MHGLQQDDHIEEKAVVLDSDTNRTAIFVTQSFHYKFFVMVPVRGITQIVGYYLAY